MLTRDSKGNIIIVDKSHLIKQLDEARGKLQTTIRDNYGLLALIIKMMHII